MQKFKVVGSARYVYEVEAEDDEAAIEKALIEWEEEIGALLGRNAAAILSWDAKPAVITCPKCEQELDHLLSLQQDLVTYEFDGKNYTEVDRVADMVGIPVYVCPQCGVELATGEDEAKKILGR